MYYDIHCSVVSIICRNPGCPTWMGNSSKPFPTSIITPNPAGPANGIQFTIQFHSLVKLEGIFLGRIVIISNIYPARIGLHFHEKHNIVVPPVRIISIAGNADNRPSPICRNSINIKGTFRVKRKRV